MTAVCVRLDNAVPPRGQTPPSLQIALAQDYHFKLGGSKLVNSLVTFHVDPSTNLITR
jgi:hypothetical protein